MQYHVEYEACSLLFLFVVAVRFFSMRRFPNDQNRLFGLTLWFAVADLSLDILGAYTIERAADVPVWVNYVINTAFYAFQILFPAIMALYVAVLAGRSLRTDRRLWLMFLPAGVFLGMLLINPFTQSVFSLPLVNGTRAYVHGPLFLYLYVGTGIYVGATLVLAVLWKKRMLYKQYAAVLAFVAIVVAAVIVQYRYPAWLLTGVALTLAIMMIFFTMQNPEDMLDLISGVFNYSAMMSFLGSRLREKKQLWLIAADIGGIRRINSAFGVSVGNEVFAAVGGYFNALPRGIWAFRMIGTRFLLVAEDADGYRRTLEDVGDRFAAPWHVGDMDISLSVTIRYFGEWGFFKTPEDVVNLIDVAYSEVGAEGWGVPARISSELMLQANRRMTVEAAIREALRTGKGFSLCFQPICDIQSGKYPKAEALLRLDSPELGRVSPSEFIPVAEKTGLITQIDDLVIRKCCEFYARNEADLRSLLTCLEINLSAAEFFKNPSERIHALVRSGDTPPRLICFEVTETVAAAHQGILSDFMHAMLHLGYRFALDDFGTGYANITRVTELPFDIIKLDRTLLAQEDEKSRLLFAGLLGIFRRIGLYTVVEGVETPEQAERAATLGADSIQGFYYARPMPEEEYIAFMRKQGL
jgi:EAL domain-containing protein (putative c-di-GMP-specific phosphodiesterase class I)/GGDEF domain-containing protein